MAAKSNNSTNVQLGDWWSFHWDCLQESGWGITYREQGWLKSSCNTQVLCSAWVPTHGSCNPRRALDTSGKELNSGMTSSFWHLAAQGLFPYELFTPYLYRWGGSCNSLSSFCSSRCVTFCLLPELPDPPPPPALGNPLSHRNLLYKKVYFNSQCQSPFHHCREIMMAGVWAAKRSPGKSAIQIHSGFSYPNEPNLTPSLTCPVLSLLVDSRSCQAINHCARQIGREKP